MFMANYNIDNNRVTRNHKLTLIAYISSRHTIYSILFYSKFSLFHVYLHGELKIYIYSYIYSLYRPL